MKSSEPEFITIGVILSSWGMNGALKVQVATDFPERFSPESEVFVDRKPAVIESAVPNRDKVIIKLDIVDSTAEAERLKGKLVEIHHSQLQPLPAGQYYHFQLVGLEVETVDGRKLGKITDVLTMSGNDIYVVKGKGSEILIPAIEEVIKSVELDEGRMIIEPMKGLLDLNEKAAK
jgi:16S rRNA processing protein RimM